MNDSGRECPRCHAIEVVGHEIRGVYDGVLFWSCATCGWAWKRWNDGGRLTEVSELYVDGWNRRMSK